MSSTEIAEKSSELSSDGNEKETNVPELVSKDPEEQKKQEEALEPLEDAVTDWDQELSDLANDYKTNEGGLDTLPVETLEESDLADPIDSAPVVPEKKEGSKKDSEIQTNTCSKCGERIPAGQNSCPSCNSRKEENSTETGTGEISESKKIPNKDELKAEIAAIEKVYAKSSGHGFSVELPSGETLRFENPEEAEAAMITREKQLGSKENMEDEIPNKDELKAEIAVEEAVIPKVKESYTSKDHELRTEKKETLTKQQIYEINRDYIIFRLQNEYNELDEKNVNIDSFPLGKLETMLGKKDKEFNKYEYSENLLGPEVNTEEDRNEEVEENPNTSETEVNTEEDSGSDDEKEDKKKKEKKNAESSSKTEIKNKKDNEAKNGEKEEQNNDKKEETSGNEKRETAQEETPSLYAQIPQTPSKSFIAKRLIMFANNPATVHSFKDYVAIIAIAAAATGKGKEGLAIKIPETFRKKILTGLKSVENSRGYDLSNQNKVDGSNLENSPINKLLSTNDKARSILVNAPKLHNLRTRTTRELDKEESSVTAERLKRSKRKESDNKAKKKK